MRACSLPSKKTKSREEDRAVFNKSKFKANDQAAMKSQARQPEWDRL